MVERRDVLVHHPSNQEFLNQALQNIDGMGHSELGKAPQMADRKHEAVDTVKGLSGHDTRTGELPVHPNFGVRNGK